MKWHRVALAAVSLVILYWFIPEIRYASLSYNDGTLHLSILRAMDEVWARGGNITDFWMANINFGHALLRSYQFLFHLVVWVMHKTILSGLELERCFNVCVTAMAMALPWGFYKGARLFGLARFEAVVAAIALVLMHERRGYGIGLTNYTYSGYGLYTQLLATVFFLPAVSMARRLLLTGKGALPASVLFALTFLSHIVTGYMACLWIAIDGVVLLATRKTRAKTAALAAAKYGGLVLLWTSHWLVPMAQDGLYQRKSDFELSEKWTGAGAEVILGELSSGQLFDADRLRVLTMLAAAGLVVCVLRKDRRLFAIQAIAWLALSFGPYTWGALLSELPFAGHLHWHRLIAGLQMASALCLGVGIAAFWKWLVPARPMNIASGVLLLGSFLLPCLAERQEYFYKTNVYWLTDTLMAWKNNTKRYAEALAFARAHGDARYYAGDIYSWGDDLRVSSTVTLFGLLPQYNVETVGPIYHHQSHTEVLAFKADWMRPELRELGNVRYLALPQKKKAPEQWKPLVSFANGTLYDTQTRPDYFAVGSQGEEGCADNRQLADATLSFINNKALVAAKVFPVVRLARECPGSDTITQIVAKAAASLPPASKTGSVLSSSFRRGAHSDIHEARVNLLEPGLVVFKMNYHPGWIATVDGKRVETKMVLPSFIAVPVEKGGHTISMEYVPLPLKRALGWLAVFSYVAVPVILGVNRFVRRRTA